MVSPDSRAVFAALANDSARSLYAAHVLGTPDAVALSPSKRKRATEALASAGLLVNGEASADPFRDLLREVQRPARTVVEGPERFFSDDGRLERIPRSHDERTELFALVAQRTLSEGDRIDERSLGERLAEITDDVPLLRRHLVDYGFLDRTPAGAEYWRA